ncbi:hypothetical protein [Sphingopyxis sp. MSC1_008]|jgi:uncharacterized protein involved in tolerance to divalent cations|uniref:hypothetical protein n=1 Tax=Sphingopyxis sp. MSC1_008 TaxID=2909265 RepID=UPI0020C118C3|nr:hypothetical protein [Sphingopyxis sp. MSC1_008]
MKVNLAKVLHERSTIWQAGIVAAISYASAVVVNLVTADASSSARFWILVCGGLVACVIMAIIATAIDAISGADRVRREREYATHRSGYQTLNREISQYISLARRLQPGAREMSKAVVDMMFSACQDLYDTLETEYSYKVSVRDHIEFEVTFMTRSLEDDEITIAAWANRDGRAPKSLAGRKTNPKVYVGTETDLLYQDDNRTPRFIASTDGVGYKELYPGQKTRIKSSVIWPVVDDEFGLRGTLVVHCDRDEFFSSGSEKLWRETLEPYTKRLALARVLADRAAEGDHRPNF